MKTATTMVQNLIRLTWLVLLVLGILLWMGPSKGLQPVHGALGVAFVLALLALAYIGLRCGVTPGLVAIVFLWSLVTLVIGLTQTVILAGSLHWIIQLLHLVVGFVAIGLAEALGGRIKRGLAQGIVR